MILFLAISFLSSCHTNDILSVNQMADILLDIYRFNGTVSQLRRPVSSEQKVLYYEHIFARHNTSKEQFDRSLKWYADHPSSWKQVYELLEQKGVRYAESVENKELPQLKGRKDNPGQKKEETVIIEQLQSKDL